MSRVVGRGGGWVYSVHRLVVTSFGSFELWTVDDQVPGSSECLVCCLSLSL
jgi:hypothetical protein